MTVNDEDNIIVVGIILCVVIMGIIIYSVVTNTKTSKHAPNTQVEYIIYADRVK